MKKRALIGIASALFIVASTQANQSLPLEIDPTQLNWSSLESVYADDKVSAWFDRLPYDEKEKFVAMLQELDSFLSYADATIYKILESHGQIAEKFFEAQKVKLIKLILQLGSSR
jgi:hypothetical protein